MTNPTAPGAGSGAAATNVAESATALSRELGDFLIELSIGLHKHSMYPPGHPLLEGATAGLARRLDTMLVKRSSLSLGVARQQLVIEGVATDENNPVLRDLAARLHKHHLGAVKFLRGVTPEELVDALATIAVDVGRRERPLGLEGEDVLQKWEHIRLFPLTFEQLQLLEEDPDFDDGKDELRGDKSRAAQLWIGLARAAIAADADSEDGENSTDPVLVAKAIDDHKKDAAYDQVVVGYLLQIAEELKAKGGKGGKDAAALQRRISRLVATLQPDTLSRLLHMGGDVRQRKKFVLDATQGMAVDAVVELVQAAADSSSQNVSHSLVRMLSKMAVHADEGEVTNRRAADSTLRDSVHNLISNWTLEDLNPDGYRRALDKMSQAVPVFETGDDAYPCEPERMLAMGVEIETLGDPVWRAVTALAAADDLPPLLTLLDNAPEGWARSTLWRHVAAPDTVARQIDRGVADLTNVERLASRMGLAAVDSLLDGLESAEERRAATIVELIVAMGPQAGPRVAARLDGARSPQLRTYLNILSKLGELPPDFDLWPYTEHYDPTVRREAVRALIRMPEARERAIVAGLNDADERIVRVALGAAMSNCPADAARVLLARADDSALSPDLRALGIRAASSFRDPATLTFLLSKTTGKRRLLRRQVLADPTPEMLAALTGPVSHWADEPAAQDIIAAAKKSSDKDIRDATIRRSTMGMAAIREPAS